MLEDLVFCIKRAGWKVTKIHSHLTFEQKRFKHKIHSHLTFEQKRFKQKFIMMNQKPRQQSENNVEKDF